MMRHDTPGVAEASTTAEDPGPSRAGLEALEAQLRAAEAEIAAILEHSSDLAHVVDADGRLTYANSAWREALGYEAGLPVALNIGDVLVEESRDTYRAACRELLDGAPVAPIDARLCAADGREIEVQGILVARVLAAGNIAVRGVFRNLVARQRQDAHLAYVATHDRLTGLANRAHLLQSLPDALARSARAGTAMGIIHIDLDDFRDVNARVGHAWADQALVTVADRLRRCVRAGDTAARLGGDEFAVIVERVEHPGDIRRVAERAIDAIATPLFLGGQWVLLRGSAGGAVGTPQATDAERLLLAAEAAMLQVKQAGGGRFALAGAGIAMSQR